jgi:outer membrane protein TolC
MTFSINVPFGGGDHLAPEIAASNLEFSEALVQRDRLFRTLKQTFHEAEHRLEVDRAELKIANELQMIAQSHLKMARLSFDAGETNLMDFLKVQTRTQEAIQNASEKNIILQRDIALYNQAVGVLP